MPNNRDDSSTKNNKSKQKDHPKLINPSNTIKMIPNEINEIKEEAFEESLEQFQTKKNNLKIIIPDKSNDELEPSTSGSSNLKLSPNTPSPLIDSEKNKINSVYKINENNQQNNREGDEENYQMTAHFTNEEKSSKEKKNIEKPYTPNYVRHKRMFNPPLTSDNKNINKYKFNYNFETKSNGIIVPKEVKKINQIKRQNLFKVGNNNINKNQKNKNKMKPCSSRIEQIFGTQGNSPRNSSLVSITNNINEKIPMHNNKKINIFNKYSDNKIKFMKKNKNRSFIENKKYKSSRANSMENKYLNKEKSKNKNDKKINNNNNKIENNSFNEIKNYKTNKNNYLPQIKKIINVKNKINTEMNNLFNILPEDYENKYPEIKNDFNLIIKTIHYLNDYIFKKTENSFRKNK